VHDSEDERRGRGKGMDPQVCLFFFMLFFFLPMFSFVFLGSYYAITTKRVQGRKTIDNKARRMDPNDAYRVFGSLGIFFHVFSPFFSINQCFLFLGSYYVITSKRAPLPYTSTIQQVNY
jgi:hypothetical protein